MAEELVRRVRLRNELGLHLRAAGRFVKVASRFVSAIGLERDGMRVDGKSIMGLLSLAAARGQELTISAEGPDAAAALDALADLVARGLEEAS